MFGKRKKTARQGSETERPEISADRPTETFPPVDQLPDSGVAIPEWREDNDVCYCGRYELVYGGNVNVQLRDGTATILHRKWTMCEVFRYDAVQQQGR